MKLDFNRHMLEIIIERLEKNHKIKLCYEHGSTYNNIKNLHYLFINNLPSLYTWNS
jgi:hypothetical protein